MSLEFPNRLPVLPTNNGKVLLPGIITRLLIERKESIEIFKSFTKDKKDHYVAVIPVKSSSNKEGKKATNSRRILRALDPEYGLEVDQTIAPTYLFKFGVVGRVVQVRPDLNGKLIVLIEGVVRLETTTLKNNVAQFIVHVDADVDKNDLELNAVIQTFLTGGRELLEALKQLQLPAQILQQLSSMLDSTNPGQLADLLASMIDLYYEERLEILSLVDLKDRLTRTIEFITRQLQVFQISQKLSSSIENKLGAKQRELLLREQLEAIKKELGESADDNDNELSDLEKRMLSMQLPEEILTIAKKEYSRLKRINPNMAEHQVIRNYLEWIFDLPWGKSSEDHLDVSNARKVLDADHFGLEKVKNRIIEYLSIRKLKKDVKGPILCFLGPPGVGKTSLGKSIANSLGRKFYRIALGGVRDEAEIRGHRRTYIGAMPGLFIQALKRCSFNNPVILLDEIDKIGKDNRGDPAAALLEVLDPEQNAFFTDHYMNMPFDLSKVLFIATANDASTIPGPLLDRMELIQLNGYTIDEKLNIARRHLLPKQVVAHGLPKDLIQVSDAVLDKIIVDYTREAGVRSLERQIGSICRSFAVEYSEALDSKQEKYFKGTVTKEKVEDILGVAEFENQLAQKEIYPGVSTGLAWTSTGSGDILFIETSQSPGSGKLTLTGKLGNVIKESIQIGYSWIRSNYQLLGLTPDAVQFEKKDIHVHFPAGATPKDGPSAGIAIVVALISLLKQKPIDPYIAMTGEFTLRGLVLPVGGIKEKLIAAHRAGIKKVLIPDRNVKDLREIPSKVLNEIEIVPCKKIEQVLTQVGLIGLVSKL